MSHENEKDEKGYICISKVIGEGGKKDVNNRHKMS